MESKKNLKNLAKSGRHSYTETQTNIKKRGNLKKYFWMENEKKIQNWRDSRLLSALWNISEEACKNILNIANMRKNFGVLYKKRKQEGKNGN